MTKLLTKNILPDNSANIEGLVGCCFLIKDYQRGYRWEEKQIEDLLNDILDMKKELTTQKYCLQPLVVKAIDHIESYYSISDALANSNIITCPTTSNWELIDGQQRLTTIWLILQCCNSNLVTPLPLPYHLFYENIREIDQFYLTKAIETIHNWFNKEPLKREDRKNTVRQIINENIQFIWYEVDEDTNSSDIFNKINVGKIPLTNAELFKAQLLNEDIIPYDKHHDVGNFERAKSKLEKIAFEWDKLEQSLRENDFWFFISNEEKKNDTRIDFLLTLLANQLKEQKQIDENIKEYDTLFPFLAINDYLKKEQNNGKELFESQIQIWERIVKLHDTLKAWSMDHELYHYIGFLVTVEAKKGKYIDYLVSKIDGLKQSKIKELILENIREIFQNVKIDELDYSIHKKKIRWVLLFFNVYTMIQSGTDAKFSFQHFKDKNISWDLEHIHARATDSEIQSLTRKESFQELLEGIKNQFIEFSSVQNTSEIDYQSYIQEIDDYIAEKLNNQTNDSFDKEKFFEFYRKLTDLCGDFDENGLGNLTLLDYQTNRSYHNDLFPSKRKEIIERDKGEVFIPVCTKNVFLKMYSNKVVNMMKWTSEDAEDYLNAIKKALVEEAKVCQ